MKQLTKTLSFSEFRRYCAGKDIERIIYNTENNSRIVDAANCRELNPLHINLSFQTINFVFLTAGLNIIHLVSPVGAIAMYCVEKVALKNYPSWDEARVYCKRGDRVTAYNLLIDY